MARFLVKRQEQFYLGVSLFRLDKSVTKVSWFVTHNRYLQDVHKNPSSTTRTYTMHWSPITWPATVSVPERTRATSRWNVSSASGPLGTPAIWTNTSVFTRKATLLTSKQHSAPALYTHWKTSVGYREFVTALLHTIYGRTAKWSSLRGGGYSYVNIFENSGV